MREAYRLFNDLLDTTRGQNESMERFNIIYTADVAKFNSISNATKLTECLTALMLISNSYISDVHRVSVLAVAASASDIEEVSTATIEHLLQPIQYSSVTSVFKQCEENCCYDYNDLRKHIGTTSNK